MLDMSRGARHRAPFAGSTVQMTDRDGVLLIEAAW